MCLLGAMTMIVTERSMARGRGYDLRHDSGGVRFAVWGGRLCGVLHARLLYSASSSLFILVMRGTVA